MKQAFVAATMCVGLLALGPPIQFGYAQDAARPIPPQVAQANLQATRAYYTGLIAGPSPNLAGLALMMTMMPKGGDLHHHYSGAIYAETFLDWVKQKDYCVWTVDYPQRPGAFKYTIETKPADVPDDMKAKCLKVDEVLKPAQNAFYRNLLSTWSDKDFSNHSHEQSAPDQHFFDTFFYISPISTEYANFGLRQLKARAIAENVQYIETMFRRPAMTKNAELAPAVDKLTSDSSDADVAAALGPLYDFLAADVPTRDTVTQFLADLDTVSDGIDDTEFKMRFQTYVSRNDPPSMVFSSLYSGFAAADGGRKVVGINILGPENAPVSMRDYTLHMRMFAFLKHKFPKVNLSMHAGELALGMVPPEGLQSHVREAVEIAGTQRIGHGVDIAHERDASGLLRLMRERKVAVEINLTSNEFILGVKGEAHPVLLYRHAGVPFMISTDDAGVSRNNLSGEYVLYASRYRPNYDALKETALNSIRHSFLSAVEKTAELNNLTQRFAQFEAKVRDLSNGLPSTGGAAPQTGR